MKREKNIVNYINTTSSGQSGVPLILKLYNDSGRPEYVVIGLHKGVKGGDQDKKSYGIIVTSENTIEVAQLARKFVIMDQKNLQEV
jgi:hypothetical protein